MIIDYNKILLRLATKQDMEYVAEIYNQGIETGYSTFDEFGVNAERYYNYSNPSELESGIVIAEYCNQIIGWSSFEPISGRFAYRFTCLGSTYIRKEFRSRMIGTMLIAEKLKITKERGYHSIVGEVLSINEGALSLCYSLGFKLVGEIKEAGFRNGNWIGLTVIQKML